MSTAQAPAALAEPRWRRLPAVLRERDFRRFWVGETVSMLGDQITLMAIPLTAVLVLDASPAEMGYLGAALLVPNLLFSLHAGAWVDRHGRRRQVMVATAFGRAALLASVPIAYAFDALTMPQLYVVGFGLGTLTVFFTVSYSTLFVSLVSRERYVEGSSLLNGSRAFSYIAGTTLGGLLVQLLSAPGALVADACSFLFSALTLRSISPEEPPIEPKKPGHLRAGARFIVRSPVIRSILLATTTINFFNFAFWALFFLYVNRELGIGPAALGLVLGAASVGSLIGSFLTGRLTRRIGIGRALAVGCVLFPAPLILVPLAGGDDWTIVLLLFLAEFFSGLGVMMLDISAGAIDAALIPDRLRARVSGACMVVNYGVRPLGALIGGALGTWLGVRPTLWIASVGALAGGLWLLPSPVLGLRALPEPDEAAA